MLLVHHSRELQKLNRLTNTQLKILAEEHAHDRKFLGIILQILKPRTRSTADLARHRVSELLDQDRLSPGPTNPWYQAWLPEHARLGLALAGLIAAGIGQAAGGQIWNAIWSWLTLAIFGQPI